MLFSDFFRGRSRGGRARQRSRRTLPRYGRAFSPERLEARLPLAFNITTTTLTSDDNGPLTFAYNITIDDQVDSQGFGRDIFLTRFDSGTPLVKIADNPSFNNATTLGIRVGRAECTTFFVTSAGRQKALFATSDPAPVVPNAIPITLLDNIASFNLADKTNPALQGINPLGISGRAVFDYTDPDGNSFTPAFTYQASALAAYGVGALTITQTNPQVWSDAKLAVPTGIISTTFDPITNDYVTSVLFQFATSSGDFGVIGTLDVTNAPYEYFDPSPANPQSFTVSQGQNFDQRLIVDLAPVGSRISINSSWFAKLGDNDGDKPGINVDPTFYRAYDGVLGVGQLDLYASEVVINQDVSSVNRIAIGGPANVFTRSGNLDPTSADPTVVTNLSSVANLFGGGGLFVSGPGIAPDTTVVAVDPFTSSITLSKPPTLTQTNVSLKFSQPRPSGYIRETSALRFLANAQSPSFNIEVAGSQAAHGQIFVSQAGSLTGLDGAPAGALAIDAQSTDIRFEGNVSAASQGYFLSAQGSADQYTFTTRSDSTGTQTGLLSGDTVAFTLGQPGGGNVDLKTNVNNLRFDSGVNTSGVPYRYTVAIEDANDLIVDAVAASSGPITLSSATGKLSIKGSAVRTTGDLTAIAATSLSFDGSVSASNGNVTLVSPTLTLGSSVTAGGGRGVSLQSKTGSSSINALVQAGGQLKAPVRVATTAPIDLATGGLLTVDGVALVAGDRVLVKNQTVATENGIYGVSAGTWVRATDANTSALLVPGFLTFASEGLTQKGGWTFQNPANPILGQTGTGLSFVPLSATLTYGPANAATTGPINLATNGLSAIDNVTLAEGDRVLVKNQANPADNGIYVASVGPWLRASDADSVEELRAGSYVFVTGGTTNGSQGFALLNDAVQVGTTDLGFGRFLVESQRTNFWSPSNTLRSVRAATTVNLESLAGLQTIDGVKLATGDRLLVKNQIIPSANGVYVAAAGAWTRAADASLGTNFAYDTFVYVNEGTVGRGTGWRVDSSAVMTGTLAADSNLVTGLRSTEGLTIGMAVEGDGIPAGSTITGVGADGTSVFLSRNARFTASLSLVRFANFTNPTVGVTPLVFRAVGGTINVASAADISGSPTQGRLLGQNVVLTAGTGGAGQINTKTTASTISAVAPGKIDLENGSQAELSDVRSGTGADVIVLSAGTLTASAVAAGANVLLSSTYGDVVAGRVGSITGTITLSSLVSNTAIANATGTARVTAQNGSVIARADKGAVIVNGQVAAQGPGSDVSFISNFSSATASDPAALRFGPLADVAASDQLIIDTPNSMPTVDPLAKLTAARLSLRSKLFGTTAPPPSLGTFPTVQINRTDSGDINYSSPSILTVEGATTVSGSIAFSAPELKVTGGIATVGTNTDVTLTASTDNLRIDGTVTSQRDVLLNATGGSITSSTSGRTALITAPRNVVVAARDNATLLTKAQGLSATLTGAGSALDVQDDDGLIISSAILTGGGNATFQVGTAALGGAALVGLIDVGPSGTVAIDAFGDIIESTIDPTAEIVAKSATFKSANGRIDLDTTVDVLTASTLQKTAPITLRDLGVGPTPLQLASITGAGTSADVTVTSARPIAAVSVITAGRVNLTTTTPAAAIQVGKVTATGNTATINAGGSVSKLNAGSLLTATSAVLDSASGSIDAMLAASNVAAATGAGGPIALQDADALSIGNDLLGRGISTTGPVTITVGGALTQTQSLVAPSLTATSTGGAITLTNAGNDVDFLTVTNGTRAVSFTDKDDLAVASIAGGPITLSVGGTLTQTGPITGTTLAITGTAGAVTLTNAGNAVDSLTVNNGTRNVSYTDKDDLAIAGAGIVGGNVSVTAGNVLTVAAPVTAGTASAGDGDITLTSKTSNIVLAANLTATADRVTLNGGSGTITQTAGSIDAQTLVWFAKSLPTPNPLVGTYGIIGPNLTTAGNLVIGPFALPITIAGASTVDGNVTITGSDVTITDRVQAGGAAKSVAVTATAGSIAFQAAGRVITSGGSTTLSAANGSVTAANVATQTTVTGSSLSLTAKNSSTLSSAVDTFAGTVSAGDLTLTETTGVALGAVAAQAITLSVGGNLTQTAPLTGTTLTITGTAGSIALTNANNDVDSLTVNNGTRGVSFTDKDDLAINGAGIVGGNVAVTAGTALTVNSPVTAGTAAAGDGDITLTSVAGSIALAADLTARADRITLDASNGTITQTVGAIDSQTLVWFAQSPPSPNPLAGTYGVVGQNLTTPGDLVIGPFARPITLVGTTTTDGNITVTGTGVTITDLVQARGAAKSVAVTATTGSIAFQSAGRIVTTAGSTTLSAANGTIAAANTATQTTVTGSSLSLTAQGNSNLTTAVDNVAGTVSAGNLTLTDLNGLALGGVSARAVTLGAGGNLTQTAPLTATTLSISATSGTVTLTDPGNDADSLFVDNGTRAVSFTDKDDLAIAGITAGDITLNVGAPLTQTGPVVGGLLSITSRNRGIQLTNPTNDVTSLFVSNPGRIVSFTDKNDLVVAGITGGSITLDVGAPLSQTGPIVGASLSVTSRNRGVQLTNAANDVDSLFGSNPGRIFFFTDRDDLSIYSLTAGTASLSVGGTLTQDPTGGSIVAPTAVVFASAGAVTLTTPSNDVGTLTVTNAGRPVAFTDKNALAIGGITAGDISLGVGGDLTQTNPITGSSLAIAASSGVVALANPANRVPTLNLSNGGRLFSYADSGSVAITSAGTLAVGTVTAATNVTVTTTGGGGVDVGPQPNGLLQAGSTIDLRNVQGAIGIRNGGRIVAPSVLLPPGKSIQVGGTITTAAGLNQAIDTINGSPAIPGLNYEIVVSASFALTQSLIIQRPVVFSGTSQSVVLSGSASVSNGLLLGSGASGSTIRNIAFSGFIGDAIRLTGATGIGITGVRVSNSGNGLSINGASTNSVMQGNVFDRNATGIRLTSATGVLIGGNAAGQANTISNSTLEAVFATGFCTGSQLVKNNLSGNAKNYNVSASRGLTIVT